MEKKVREFLKSHDLYPERGIHNESGTLIGLGDLLNNFAKSLSPSTDSSEVSDEEIERMALERFKIEGWEMKHPVEGVTRGSLQINHKLAFIEGFKKCLELRSKLKSQWVSVDNRLPDEGQDVLCAVKVSTGYWFKIGRMLDGFISLDRFLNCNNEITHWQPLPESPIK